MKKALITGVTGQDGSYLAEFLLEKGYKVYGIKRRSSTINTDRVDHIFDNPNFEMRYGDLSDALSLVNILKDIEPDEVYNLAAQSHVQVSFENPEYTGDIDGLGTLRLLEAIRILGLECKFYQASSSEMYGKVQEVPQDESTPFYPRSPYGCAKLYAHWITVNYRESYGIFACSGILFNHESPRRGETFVTRKITRAIASIAKGEQDCLYLGNLDALRDWGHAKDYVRLMWLMLQHDTPDDYVIATGEQYTVRQFLVWAAESVGIKLAFNFSGEEEEVVVVESTCKNVKVGDIICRVNPRYYRPAEVDSLLGNPEKAKRILGWKPSVSVQQLCSEMVHEDLGDTWKTF